MSRTPSIAQAALVVVVVVRFGLRLWAGPLQPMLSDEQFSFLGAAMVARQGIPLLPRECSICTARCIPIS